MWSPEQHRPKASRRAAAVAVALMSLAGLQACTVRPLYMNAPMSPATGQSITTDLSQVGIKPVTTREAQEVRNHLIFLFSGGQGEPVEPRYMLDLGVTRSSESAALIQVGTENEPTAAMVTMRSSYRLMSSSGDVVAEGQRQFVSSYDVPRQEFAALRAKRDAENRAARELAELVRLSVAQDLTKLQAQ